MAKTLIKKLLIYIIPFVIALVWFFGFEPYDYLNIKGDAFYMSKPLSSTRELLLTCPENVIFGDSRMANMNVDYIEEITGERYTMMAFGGATLNDAINEFWYATEHTDMKKVVIGVNFYALNSDHLADRFTGVIPLAENPFKFISSFGIWYEAFENCRRILNNFYQRNFGDPEKMIFMDDPSSLTQKDPVPPDSYNGEYRTDLFDYAHIIKGQVSNYQNPDMYIKELNKIIDYCNQNEIELTIVIAPSHFSIWELVVFDLELQYYIRNYKDHLKSRATVYDFEWYNDYSKNDENFIDGFHLSGEQKLAFTRAIFNDELGDFCVKTTPEQYIEYKESLSEPPAFY